MIIPDNVFRVVGGGMVQVVGFPTAVINGNAIVAQYQCVSPFRFTVAGLDWFLIDPSALDGTRLKFVYDNGGKVYRGKRGQQIQEICPMYMEIPWAARNNKVPAGITGRMNDDDPPVSRTWAEWAVAGGASFRRSLDGTKALLTLSFGSTPITVPEVLILKAAGGTILNKVEVTAAMSDGGDYYIADV